MLLETITVAGATQLDISYVFSGGPLNPDALPCIFVLSYRTAQASPHEFYARFVPAAGLAENLAADIQAPTTLYSYSKICRSGTPVPRPVGGLPFLLRITSTGKTADGTVYFEWAWRTIS